MNTSDSKKSLKKRVLVVDDELKFRKILERVFSREGYDVRTAGGVKEALKIIPGFGPHLVIAEVALPGLSGFELCREIRANSRFRTTRFIFLTSKDTREDEIEGLMLGADDYIVKPIDVDKLLARVDTRLRWVDKIELNASGGGLLEGSLGGRNLIDVLQVLEIGQKTGELAAYDDEKQSRILISHGRIVSAVSADRRGKLAVYHTLTWPKGRFSFIPGEVSEGEEVLEITPLILEWARIADELLRKKSSSTTKKGTVDEFVGYIREREKEGKE